MNKEKTIKKNHQFRWIIKKGKKSNKKTVRIFVAIKKNIKSAILRNRVKRVIREIYRLEENKLKKQFNIIICFNTDVVDFNEIYNDIRNGFYDLNMYKNKENL